MNRYERMRAAEIEKARRTLAEKQPDVIEAKKAAAERRRQDWESHWLKVEREKYGLAKQRRPLSRQLV